MKSIFCYILSETFLVNLFFRHRSFRTDFMSIMNHLGQIRLKKDQRKKLPSQKQKKNFILKLRNIKRQKIEERTGAGSGERCEETKFVSPSTGANYTKPQNSSPIKGFSFPSQNPSNYGTSHPAGSYASDTGSKPTTGLSGTRKTSFTSLPPAANQSSQTSSPSKTSCDVEIAKSML